MEEGEVFAKQHDLLYIEVSAKKNQNIAELFELALCVIEKAPLCK